MQKLLTTIQNIFNRARTLFDRDPLHYDESGRRPWGMLLLACGVLLAMGTLGHYLVFARLDLVPEEQYGEVADVPVLDSKRLDRALTLYHERQRMFEAVVATSTQVADPSR